MAWNTHVGMSTHATLAAGCVLENAAMRHDPSSVQFTLFHASWRPTQPPLPRGAAQPKWHLPCNGQLVLHVAAQRVKLPVLFGHPCHLGAPGAHLLPRQRLQGRGGRQFGGMRHAGKWPSAPTGCAMGTLSRGKTVTVLADQASSGRCTGVAHSAGTCCCPAPTLPASPQPSPSSRRTASGQGWRAGGSHTSSRPAWAG